jgi:hypothetical protein
MRWARSYGTSVIVGPQGEPLVVLPTDREVFGVTTINLALGATWDNWRLRLDPQLLAPLRVRPQTPSPSVKFQPPSAASVFGR